MKLFHNFIIPSRLRHLKSNVILSAFLSVCIFILLPFLYSFNLQDIETSPRFLALAVIVTISSVLSIMRVSSKGFSLKNDTIYLLALLFLVVNLFALFRSICFYDGLFEYLKLLLYYSLLFQFVIALSEDEKNKILFFKAIGVSAVVFIFLGAAQFIPSALDSIEKGRAVRIDYSITSTLGNKNFFAETLLFMLPVSLLAIAFHNRGWRVFFIVVSTCIFISLVVLQTLSTWAALFISGIVIIVILARFRQKIFVAKNSFRIFSLVVTGSVLAAFLCGIVFVKVVGTSQIQKRISTFQRILNPDSPATDSLNTNSTYERIILWKSSIKMIADHPVAGAGLSNWKILSPTYGLGSARYMTTGVIRFVHPHNEMLFYASESGIIGLAVLLAIICTLIYYCYLICKNARDFNEMLPGFAVLFGITAFVIVSMFSLPSTRIFPPILFMFFIALSVSERNKSLNQKPAIRKSILISLLIVSLISGITSVYIGNKRLRSDFNLSSALHKDREKNYDSMRRYLDKIDKKYFPLDVTATPIAWYHGYSWFYTGNRDKAFELFKEAEKANPNHLMVLNDLATCYNLSGDPATAEKYYNKALSIQPAFRDAIVNLSIIYFNAGKVDEAYKMLLHYDGTIKRESVPVFQTILLAKARMITSDEVKIQRFESQLKDQRTITKTLVEIKSKKGEWGDLMGN